MTPTIRKVQVKPQGIDVVLDEGGRRRFVFGVVEAADVSSVHIAEGREAIIIKLRSGSVLEWHVEQMTEV